jgi:hypothetical protein
MSLLCSCAPVPCSCAPVVCSSPVLLFISPGLLACFTPRPLSFAPVLISGTPLLYLSPVRLSCAPLLRSCVPVHLSSSHVLCTHVLNAPVQCTSTLLSCAQQAAELPHMQVLIEKTELPAPAAMWCLARSREETVVPVDPRCTSHLCPSCIPLCRLRPICLRCRLPLPLSPTL